MNTVHDAPEGGLDRVVIEDRRPEALPFQPDNLRLSANRQVIDPKLRRSKKVPADVVAKILQDMSAAIAEDRSLILFSKSANAFRFPAMRSGAGEELPEVVLPRGYNPTTPELDEGRMIETDCYRQLAPIELKRILGDHTFLSELANGTFSFVDVVPESALSPVQRLSIENDRLRQRILSLEDRMIPKSMADMEGARRAALTDEEREKEDDNRRKSAAASGNGPRI
jgi:hypothetical protein